MFGDMLQISVKDSYQNLPYKTISGFDYVSQFMTDVAFILKTDDDLKFDTAALRYLVLSYGTWFDWIYKVSPSTL